MQDPEINELLEELRELEPKMNEPIDTEEENLNNEKNMDDETNEELSDNQGTRPLTIGNVRLMAIDPQPVVGIVDNAGSGIREARREGVTGSVTPARAINSMAPRMEAHSKREGRGSTEPDGVEISNNTTRGPTQHLWRHFTRFIDGAMSQQSQQSRKAIYQYSSNFKLSLQRPV